MGEIEFVDDFHRLFGSFVLAHARLDFNVGLQLLHIGAYRQVDVSELLDPLKTPFALRLKKLRQLTLDLYVSAGEVARAEFGAWHTRADMFRGLRNDYAHGRWGVPGKYNFKGDGSMLDAEPLLLFTPLHWNFDPNGPDRSITMTIEEFATQVGEMEGLFKDFEQLMKKYQYFARPPSANGV